MCGVLCHLANLTLSFHGIADDAVGLLILLFEGWTSSSITQFAFSSAVEPSNQSFPPLG